MKDAIICADRSCQKKKGVRISGYILYGNPYSIISLDRDLISFGIEGIAVQHHQYMPEEFPTDI